MENGIGLRRLTYLSQRNEQINESTNSHKMYILKCSHFDGVNRIITIMVMVILKVRRAYLEKRMRKFNRIANMNRANSILECEKRGTEDTDTKQRNILHIYGFLHSVNTNVKQTNSNIRGSH